jgi:hypothetical protein
MSKEYKDLLERCLWTFVETFASTLVITPAIGVEISTLEVAALSGGAAVLSVLKSFAKNKISPQEFKKASK